MSVIFIDVSVGDFVRHPDRPDWGVGQVQSVIGANETKLYDSPDQHANWLDCIKTRQEPVAPIEVGHRSCSTCLLHQIAMKVKRKIYWDPKTEKFKKEDKEATAMLSRPRRKKYDF